MEEIFKQIEQKLEKHGKEMRGVSLSASEKNAMREKISIFIHEHPAQVRESASARHLSRMRSERQLTTKSLMSKIRMITALILAIFLSGGVSYAAEGALPGDVLYPVKTEVNEQVRVWAAISDESAAKLQVTLAEERLKEAEKLAAQGRLTAETQVQVAAKFEKHAKESESLTQKVESKNGAVLAVNIQSDFQATLEAHEKVLVELESKNEKTKEHIGAVLQEVRTKINTVADVRAGLEAKVSTGTSTEAKTSAEGAKDLAEKKIAAAKKSRGDRKGKGLQASATSSADIRVSDAEKSFEEAKVKLDAGNSVGAFSLFMKANRQAQSAKVLSNASQEFNIDIGGEDSRGSGDDEPKDDRGETTKVRSGDTSTATTTVEGSVQVKLEDDSEVRNGEEGHEDGKATINVGTQVKVEL